METTNRTFFTCLSALTVRNPKKKLLGCPGAWFSVEQVLAMVTSAAGELERRGVRRGDMVALRAYRQVDTVITLLALQYLGAVAVLTSPHQTPEEFLENSAVPIPVKTVLTEPLRPHARSAAPAGKPSGDGKAPGFIIFTSGSTGKSKAVVLSQHNLISNLLDAAPFGDYRQADIALGVLPLEHVFGLVLLTGVLVLGYSLYLPDTTSVPGILEAVQTQRITRMNGVPSLYLAMAAQKQGYDLSSLRTGFIGGGPCTPEQFRYMEQELDMTLIPAYGMSECVGITIASYWDLQEKRANSVGKFYPRNTGRILREDGTEAPAGEEGEICVDGPTRMLGYYGDPSPRQGLLATGDLGYVDSDGFVHISGRKKDIIIRNGVNLSPRKIEKALLSVAGVQDAAVVGLPDERCGELPYAMAACGSGVSEDLMEALRPLLAKNELPAGILCVPSLPRTPSGKPDKQRIREVLAQWKKV